MRRVLVCGGRDYKDSDKVFEVLDQIRDESDEVMLIIHGGAPGADQRAAEWAVERGVHTAVVKPLWDTFGKSAGPVRNQIMLELKPTLVVAFPGGAGTANMVRLAEAVIDDNGIRKITVCMVPE